jgi:hypothetical protein
VSIILRFHICVCKTHHFINSTQASVNDFNSSFRITWTFVLSYSQYASLGDSVRVFLSQIFIPNTQASKPFIIIHDHTSNSIGCHLSKLESNFSQFSRVQV